MTASLEGINVKITLELQGWFETKVPIVVNSVTVGNGLELNQYFSSRILSVYDSSNIPKPVDGPNGLLDGWLKVDISGNRVYAEFIGQAQPAGVKIKIENLAPANAAPGTVAQAGQMNGVNTIYAPTYTPANKTLELNWFMLGFQPGTVMSQSVYYDNMLEDAPVAGDDSYAVNVGQTLTGANLLANDTDLDNLGSFGIVDISTVTHINGQLLDTSNWIDLDGGGQIKVSSTGQLQFRDDGDFSDLARGATRATTFQYTVTDSAGLSDVGDVSITVTGVNSAPAITVPATRTLAENAIASPIAGIVITDVDSDAQTITLSVNHGALTLGTTTGLSFTDNNGSDGTLVFSGSLVNINAALATLQFTPTGNYVGPATLNITTSDGFVSKSGSVALDITDVKPVLAPVTTSVIENSANGTPVTTVAATADTNGLVYSITAGNEAGAFAINSTTGAITVADRTKLDFEAVTSFTLTVAVDDEDADTVADATTTVSIAVTNQNEAPTNLNLDNNALVQSEALFNAVIGQLTAVDPDAGDTFTFTLVNGAGAADNGKFVITGHALQAGEDLAAGSYNIRVKAADAAGLSYEKSLVINISDDVKPVIQAVTTLDGSLGIGGTLPVTIVAGEAGLTLEQGTINGRAITTFTDLGGGLYSAAYTVIEGDAEVAAGQNIPVAIQLRDTAGNISDAYTTGIVHTGVIDSVRPTGSTPALDALSDTGTSSSDGITRSTALTFTGTGESGATVELLDANNTVIGTGQVTAGVWNITTGTLAEGAYAVSAHYADAVGNTFKSTATNVVIDTTAPVTVADTATIALNAVPAAIANVLANDTGAAAVHSVAGSTSNIGTSIAGSNGGTFTLAANGAVAFNAGNDFLALRSGQTVDTTLAYDVTDMAGNVTASSLTVSVTGKNDAPVLSVNTGATLVSGNSITLSATQLRATDVDNTAGELTFTVDTLPASGTLRLGNTTLLAGGTFTQADIDQGRLSYVASGPAGQHGFTFSVADGGEDGATGPVSQTFLFNVTAAPVIPTQPTQPTTTTEVISGVTVTTETKTGTDGTQTHVVTVPVVTDTGAGAVLVPVVRDSNGSNVLAVDVPAGVGITVSGSVTPVSGQTSSAQFISQLETQSGTSLSLSVETGGIRYLESLPANTPVIVQTIVPVITPGAGTPGSPIVISGNSAQGTGTVTMVVIDTHNLPAGTVIELKNVSFAAVVGDITLTGGEGSQTVYADGGSQYIVLGPDDDELHGGAGDDTIGSAGGNDRLFGDDGNDTLFGGAGDDFLHGGAGEDRALYEGTFDNSRIYRNDKGQLVITGPEGTDTLESIEHIVLSDGTVSVLPFDLSGSAGALYKLYQAAFGRFGDSGGLEYWSNRMASDQVNLSEIARSFLASDEFSRRGESNASLSDIDFLEQLYFRTFNRSGDSEGISYWAGELARGIGREQVVLSFSASDELSRVVGEGSSQPLWIM